MPDFTPGKWTVEGPCLAHPFTAVTADSGQICLVCRRNSKTEKFANAMLIAEAPEMFYILDELDTLGAVKSKPLKKRIRALIERISPKEV